MDGTKSQRTEQGEIMRLESGSTSYTLIEQGEIVPLDDVAFSAYPFPGNIRATRSTHSLANSQRSARNNLAITVNNASRSSQHLGSEHSYHSGNSNYSNSISSYGRTTPAPYLQRPSRNFPAWQQTTPAPRRQQTMSTPNLEVISPIEDMSPRGDTQVESLHVPTRSATPVAFVPLDNRRISPRMPEGFAERRYDGRPRVRKRDTSITIEALQKDFINPVPPRGWIRYAHPEGARYFYNEQENVYTDADLFDPEILRQTHEDIATIQNCLTNNNIDLSDANVLVLDVFYVEAEAEQQPDQQKAKNSKSNVIQTIYHFADHEQRVVFFLDNFEACQLYGWYEISNITSETHLRCEIEAQYWYFIQLFPHALALTSPMVAELRDITLFYIGDLVTSAYSNAPYTSDDLYKFLTLSAELENNVPKDNVQIVNVGSVNLLARLMYLYCHGRFQNFHGEPNARLERNFSVHGDPIHPRTLLIKTFSIFLFLAPDFHLNTLQNMWVDGIMHKSVWEECAKKMSDEWQEFVLFATVMLNANLAFLAIQSVDIDRDPYRSPAQISSYLSVVANIGSILLGLLLMRQNRTKSKETAEDARAFLASRQHPLLGLETLAILYSLPYALLMWGMISFLAAFCFMCFQDSSTSTRSVCGSLSVAVALLITWCVRTTWEKRKEEPPVLSFMDGKEKALINNSDRKSLLKEIRPSLLGRLMSLSSVPKVRERSDTDDTVV